jgi:adenosine kinase
MKFPTECRELGIDYLYDPSQQVLRLEGKEIARDMEGAHFLFCNDYEFGLISKKTGWSLDQILEHVRTLVITRGKNGADLYSGNDAVHIPTVPEDEIVDPTGVGDAFRADFRRSGSFDGKLRRDRIPAAVYFRTARSAESQLHS